METLVLPIARYAVPPVWQIAVTIALPLVSAALFKPPGALRLPNPPRI